MKYFYSTLLISFFISLNAQNESSLSKIEHDVDFVLTIRGNNLSKKISQDKLLTHPLFVKMIKEKKDSVNNLQKKIIDMTRSTYFFGTIGDSISYNSFIIPVQNTQLINKMYQEDNIETISIKDYSVVIEDKNYMFWNDKHLFIASVDLDYSYQNKLRTKFKKEKNEAIDSDGETQNYLKEYEAIQKKIDSVSHDILYEYTKRLIKGPKKNLTSNKKFMERDTPKADISFWMDYDQIMNSSYQTIKELTRSYSKQMSLSDENPDLEMIENSIINLYLNDNNSLLEFEMEYADQWVNSIKKMMKHPFNKKLLACLPTQKPIGIISSNSNTEEILNQYPILTDKIYSNFIPGFKEEINLYSYLFSILIDEKKTAELFNGDFIFILNDISQKKVDYITYDYDEDFNQIEVPEVRTEPLPLFTFMFSATNQNFYNKLIKILEKQKKITRNDNGYLVNDTDDPNGIDFYIQLKNDVVILSNSTKVMDDIKGNKKPYTSNQELKKIKKNLSYGFLDFETLLDRFPKKEFSQKELENIAIAKDHLQHLEINFPQIKRNLSKGTLKLQTKGESENVVFNILDMFYEFDNETEIKKEVSHDSISKELTIPKPTKNSVKKIKIPVTENKVVNQYLIKYSKYIDHSISGSYSDEMLMKEGEEIVKLQQEIQTEMEKLSKEEQELVSNYFIEKSQQLQNSYIEKYRDEAIEENVEEEVIEENAIF